MTLVAYEVAGAVFLSYCLINLRILKETGRIVALEDRNMLYRIVKERER